MSINAYTENNQNIHKVLTTALEKWDATHPQESIADIFKKAQEIEHFLEVETQKKALPNLSWEKICVDLGGWLLGYKSPTQPMPDLSKFYENQMPDLSKFYEYQNLIIQCEARRLSKEKKLIALISPRSLQKRENANPGQSSPYHQQDFDYEPDLINDKIFFEARKKIHKMENVGSNTIKIIALTSAIGLGTIAYFQLKKA